MHIAPVKDEELRWPTYSGIPAWMNTRPLLDWTAVLVRIVQQAIAGLPATHQSSKRNKGIVGGTEAVAAAAPLAKGSEAQC